MELCLWGVGLEGEMEASQDPCTGWYYGCLGKSHVSLGEGDLSFVLGD